MMHIDIPTSFTESFINCLNAIKVKFNVDFYSKYLNDTSVNEFITYQKNYLCGEILHESSTLVTSTIITSIFSDALPLPDLDKYINEYIPNGEFATYGVGIGQLFMCVSM
jgi:hypothetical protein